jgi:hypothetical protein
MSKLSSSLTRPLAKAPTFLTSTFNSMIDDEFRKLLEYARGASYAIKFEFFLLDDSRNQ